MSDERYRKTRGILDRSRWKWRTKRAIGRFATYRRSCFNVFSTFPFRRKARRGFRSRLDPPKQRRNIFRSTSPLHSGPASDLVRDKKSKSFIFSKNRYGGILQRLIPEFDNSRHFVRRSGFSQSATVKIFIPRRTNRSMLDHLPHPSIFRLVGSLFPFEQDSFVRITEYPPI